MSRDALDALQSLDPGMPREQWIRVAFAAKDAGISEDDFIAWSEGAANFNRADAVTTYRNAKPVAGGVTAATLFMMAHDAGYKAHRKGNGGNGADVVAPKAAKAKPEPEPEPTDPVPIWEACRPVDVHGYLKRKAIKPHGARVNATGWLVVPYYNRDRRLQTLQNIAVDGTKRFLFGAAQKGSVAVLGEPQDAAAVLVAEGFATAAAAFEVTGIPALAAGSRGALAEGARIARHFSPRGRVIVLADRGDMSAPIAAARVVSGFVAVPGPEDAPDGFDFCDWRVSGIGDMEMRMRIDRAQAIEPEPVQAAVTKGLPSRTQATSPEPVGGAYMVDAHGKVLVNLANVAGWLMTDAAGDFAVDRFTGFTLWRGMPLQEVDYRSITIAVQGAIIDGRRAFPRASVATVADAIMVAAQAHAFNSCVQWLDTLSAWDGTERIATFFADACGIAATDYVQDVGRYFWHGLVARMVEPGTKVDSSVVLVGPQGIGKSTLAQVVGGERYVDIGLAHIGERDWCLQLRGKIVAEISELSGQSRAELETVKALTTRTHDEYREPYARTSSRVARGNVFIGTTNEADFLIDASGNRRWLPIDCPHAINFEAVRVMREQLFAEAYARVMKGLGPSWHTVQGAVDVQADHTMVDPWVEVLADKLAAFTTELPERVTMPVIYAALNIPTERQSGGNTGRRVAACMRALGYAPHRIRAHGAVVRGFIRTPATGHRTP